MSLLQTRLQTLVENRRARLRAQAAPRARPARCTRPLGPAGLPPYYYASQRNSHLQKVARQPSDVKPANWMTSEPSLLTNYASLYPKKFAPSTPVPTDPEIGRPSVAFEFPVYSALLSGKDFPLNLGELGNLSDLDPVKVSNPTEALLVSAEKRIDSIFGKSLASHDFPPTSESLSSLYPGIFANLLSSPLSLPTNFSNLAESEADAAYYSAFRQLASLFHAFHSQHTAHIQQQIAAAHSIYNAGTEALSAESLIYGNESGCGANGLDTSPPNETSERCSSLTIAENSGDLASTDNNLQKAPIIGDIPVDENSTSSDPAVINRHSTVSVQQSSPGKKRVSWTIGATSPEPRDPKRQRCSTPFQASLRVPESCEGVGGNLSPNPDVEMNADPRERSASPNIPILITEAGESDDSTNKPQNSEISGSAENPQSLELAESQSPAAAEPPLLVAESPVDIESVDSPQPHAPSVPRVNIIQPTPPTRSSISRDSPAAADTIGESETAAKALERQCVDWLDTCVRQLVMLVHATRCRQRQATATCALPNCAAMQHVITHIRSCQRWSCEYPMCVSSRQLIGHYEECEDAQCLVCYKLRVFEKTKRASHTPPAHWLTEGFKVQYNEAIRLMNSASSHFRNIA